MGEQKTGELALTAEVAAAYRSHRSDLLGFLVRRLRDRAAAEDLVQETYLRMSQSEGAVRNPRAFLFQVAANLLRNHVRNERRRLSRADVAAWLQLPADTITPERQLAAADDLRRMIAAIPDLPPQCLRVFTLSRVEGLSKQEIAHRLGISVAAVDKSLRRAVAHLMAAVKPDGDANNSSGRG